MSQQLAQYFNGIVVPEFAREYVEQLGRPYNYEDVCYIAEQNKNYCLSQDKTVFFDTELIVTKVWLDEVYHRRPSWITDPIPEDYQMDVYLLLYPDIEWEQDSVRENGAQERRMELFECYKKEVEATKKPFAIICGQGETRMWNALSAIQECDILAH